MAVAIQTTANKVKPIKKSDGGAITRRVQLGATATAGHVVSLQSDGKWDPASAAAAHLTVGVVIQSGVDTDYVDIVTHGPVECLTGATIGSLLYVNDTAGGMDHTGSTKKTVIGYAETATILYVDPQIVDFS